jgi:hypothetical protein
MSAPSIDSIRAFVATARIREDDDVDAHAERQKKVAGTRRVPSARAHSVCLLTRVRHSLPLALKSTVNPDTSPVLRTFEIFAPRADSEALEISDFEFEI